MKNKFTYDDLVQVSKEVVENLNPGAAGVVCGFSTIESEELAMESNTTVGATLYIVEFSDGSSCSIPEEYLEKINTG